MVDGGKDRWRRERPLTSGKDPAAASSEAHRPGGAAAVEPQFTGMVVARSSTARRTGVRFPPAPPLHRHLARSPPGQCSFSRGARVCCLLTRQSKLRQGGPDRRRRELTSLRAHARWRSPGPVAAIGASPGSARGTASGAGLLRPPQRSGAGTVDRPRSAVGPPSGDRGRVGLSLGGGGQRRRRRRRVDLAGGDGVAGRSGAGAGARRPPRGQTDDEQDDGHDPHDTHER